MSYYSKTDLAHLLVSIYLQNAETIFHSYVMRLLLLVVIKLLMPDMTGWQTLLFAALVVTTTIGAVSALRKHYRLTNLRDEIGEVDE